MKNIFLISSNTVKEIRRHKIFYALGAITLAMMGLGIVLGPLSLSEKIRLSIDFAFTACHIGLVLITIYFGSTLISQEIEKKTVITLFVKPVSRLEFILGKFIGLSIILLGALFLLASLVVLVYLFYGQNLTLTVFIAISGIFLESLILLALCFFFSSLTSSFLVLVFSFFVFVIGHSTNGVVFFAEKMPEGWFKTIVSKLVYFFPNFEKMNWRSNALYGDSVSGNEWLLTSFYSLSWIVCLIVLTNFFFKRKNIA